MLQYVTQYKWLFLQDIRGQYRALRVLLVLIALAKVCFNQIGKQVAKLVAPLSNSCFQFTLKSCFQFTGLRHLKSCFQFTGLRHPVLVSHFNQYKLVSLCKCLCRCNYSELQSLGGGLSLLSTLLRQASSLLGQRTLLIYLRQSTAAFSSLTGTSSTSQYLYASVYAGAITQNFSLQVAVFPYCSLCLGRLAVLQGSKRYQIVQQSYRELEM